MEEDSFKKKYQFRKMRFKKECMNSNNLYLIYKKEIFSEWLIVFVLPRILRELQGTLLNW